jgi:hypothetical protein
VGKKGHFKQFSPHQGRLYLSLQFNSTYEANFGPDVTFTVLEHGYNVYLDNQSFEVRQEEALKIKVDEMENSPLSGLVGFVFLEDITIE